MMNTREPVRMDRRTAIQWILAAGAGAVLLRGGALRGADTPGAAVPQGKAGAGYGTDPRVMDAYKPGDYWPLTLTQAQRRDVAALSDIVIPADERSPSASSVGVTEFVDEWVSAPYPDNVKDRGTILDGLEWLDAESRRQGAAAFAEVTDVQRQAICERISLEAPKGTEAGDASRFFRRFRDLVAVGYYTTPVGMREIGYVGNVPSASFEGPPSGVVAKLGLTDEVKW
jgi:hypothetical protein